MRTITVILLFAIRLSVFAQEPLPPVGEWREHLPYNSALDVTAGNGIVYCATPYSIFSVDTRDNSINRYSRVTGLQETGIRAIRYDEAGQKLFIAYTNSNIDILYRNDLFNVPDIKRDNITGDKTIYNIYPLDGNYYLSTGLGVIVIDGRRYEVRDSWFIGDGGNQVQVSGFATDANYYYAATAEGLKKTPLNVANPGLFSNWQLLSGNNGLPPGPCHNVLNIRGVIIVQKSDSLFVQNGNNWNLVYSDGWPVISSNGTENSIQLCERQVNGVGRVVIVNPDGTISRIIASTAAVSYPRKAILLNSVPWVADQFASLSRIDAGNSFEQYILNSPQAIAGGEMQVYNRVFYATSGAVNESWNYQYNGDGLFTFGPGGWTNINRYRFPVLDSLLDFITITVDKRDETIWAGSYGGGLLHVKQGPSFEIYKQGFLGPAIGDPSSFRVAGLAFDAENNLWLSNFGSSEPLRVRKNDGSWKSFTVPFPLFQQAVSQVEIDDNNYKWIVAPLGNGLLCFDHGTSIDNTGDDRWKKYSTGAGNGNLPSNEVTCLARDKDGFIWIGTTDGVGVIQCPESAFANSVCDAVWPVVSAGSFAGYLFRGQDVRSIAVDGANRKWVGTRNGVFLISAGGDKLIYRFTEDNSPLLSSDVKKITIDGYTGEIFFATLKGVCSFRGTATEGGDKNQDVLVFPNPVPPGFTGSIAIRGLVENAIVKITEPDGRLVFQTRALGGQAIWNGRNYRGEKISTGAYLVLVSDDGRSAISGKRERVAAKIFFIKQ
ncbi:MAG: two-component regulator propeller domain-containing protein [Chitinophagaceae bacterium]